jgi:hypothetical protein
MKGVAGTDMSNAVISGLRLAVFTGELLQGKKGRFLR